MPKDATLSDLVKALEHSLEDSERPPRTLAERLLAFGADFILAIAFFALSLTANVVATHGSDALRHEWLPRLLSGDWLGAYCLSEPQAGSDVSGIRTRATAEAASGSGQAAYVVHHRVLGHDRADHLDELQHGRRVEEVHPHDPARVVGRDRDLGDRQA